MSPAAEPSVAAETITIVVADDHHVVRSGLRLLLEVEDDFTVVAEAADAESALRSVLGYKPMVLVLDLNMPGDMSSLEAIPQVSDRSPGTSVVVLTMQEDPSFARAALRAGARGYVLKDSANTELAEAVRRAAAGETYLAPRLGAALAAAPAARTTSRRASSRFCASSRSGTRTRRSPSSCTSRSALSSRIGRTSSRSSAALRGLSLCGTRSTTSCWTTERATSPEWSVSVSASLAQGRTAGRGARTAIADRGLRGKLPIDQQDSPIIVPRALAPR